MKNLLLLALFLLFGTLSFGQKLKKTPLLSSKHMKYQKGKVSVNYADVLTEMNNMLQNLADVMCMQKFNREFNSKVSAERARIKRTTRYVMYADPRKCTVDLQRYSGFGTPSAIHDGDYAIEIYFIDLIPNTFSYDGKQPALVITWQMDNGRWRAGGPVQYSSAMGGHESEQQAMEPTYNETKGEPVFVSKMGKYKVYVLPYALEKWDTDVGKRLREEGHSLDF